MRTVRQGYFSPLLVVMQPALNLTDDKIEVQGSGTWGEELVARPLPHHPRTLATSCFWKSTWKATGHVQMDMELTKGTPCAFCASKASDGGSWDLGHNQQEGTYSQMSILLQRELVTWLLPFRNLVLKNSVTVRPRTHPPQLPPSCDSASHCYEKFVG